MLLKAFYFCSAHTSKRVAKVIIVFIWVLALSLAAPMAMSWEVVMEDEQDPGIVLFIDYIDYINAYNNVYYLSKMYTILFDLRNKYIFKTDASRYFT